MTSTLERVPRFPATPTGHPSPAAAALIAAWDDAGLEQLRDRAVNDGEDRIQQIRDLHHIAAAMTGEHRARAIAAWEIAVARAVGDPSPAGVSLRTIGDVCNLTAMSVRARAIAGRERLAPAERRSLEIGTDRRRHNRSRV